MKMLSPLRKSKSHRKIEARLRCNPPDTQRQLELRGALNRFLAGASTLQEYEDAADSLGFGVMKIGPAKGGFDFQPTDFDLNREPNPPVVNLVQEALTTAVAVEISRQYEARQEPKP